MPSPDVEAALVERLGVSRETLERLGACVTLLERWQRRINLVGPATLSQAWHRHVLDSAQIVPLLPPSGRIVDIGSGAGFPGLIVAIVTGRTIDLVESDRRKAAFLREAARVAAAPVEVHAERAETLHGRLSGRFAAVTARACAPLPKLLTWGAPFLAPDGVMVLHKGGGGLDELTEARTRWSMRVETTPSWTDPDGVILRIEELRGAESQRE